VSRLVTCFSIVIDAEPAPVRQETVLALCRLTPAERFKRLRDRSAGTAAQVEDLAERYEHSFLVQRDEDELVATFSDETLRKKALRSADRYGDVIYALLDV
jgi:hypothetical protein